MHRLISRIAAGSWVYLFVKAIRSKFNENCALENVGIFPEPLKTISSGDASAQYPIAIRAFYAVPSVHTPRSMPATPVMLTNGIYFSR